YEMAIFRGRGSPEAQRGAGTNGQTDERQRSVRPQRGGGLSGRHHRGPRFDRAQPQARGARLSARHGAGGGGKRQPPSGSPRIGAMSRKSGNRFSERAYA